MKLKLWLIVIGSLLVAGLFVGATIYAQRTPKPSYYLSSTLPSPLSQITTSPSVSTPLPTVTSSSVLVTFALQMELKYKILDRFPDPVNSPCSGGAHPASPPADRGTSTPTNDPVEISFPLIQSAVGEFQVILNHLYARHLISSPQADRQFSFLEKQYIYDEDLRLRKVDITATSKNNVWSFGLLYYPPVLGDSKPNLNLIAVTGTITTDGDIHYTTKTPMPCYLAP